jgi:hypothetical protein
MDWVSTLKQTSMLLKNYTWMGEMYRGMMPTQLTMIQFLAITDQS